MLKILHGLLEFPFVFKSYQKIIGATDLHGRIIKDFIDSKKNERILDIGCGPGSIIPYLPENVDYVGFDLSTEYIKVAIKNYGQKRTFFVGDVENVELDSYGPFDKMFAIGILHHLNDQQVQMMMQRVIPALRPGGTLLTLDGCFTTPQNPIARWITAADRGQHVRTQEGYQNLVEPFVQIQSSSLIKALRIPYTHLMMKISPKEEI